MSDVKPDRHRFPLTIIEPAVWLDHRLERFSLVTSSDLSGNAGAGMMVEIFDLRVQAQKFLDMFLT